MDMFMWWMMLMDASITDWRPRRRIFSVNPKKKASRRRNIESPSLFPQVPLAEWCQPCSICLFTPPIPVSWIGSRPCSLALLTWVGKELCAIETDPQVSSFVWMFCTVKPLSMIMLLSAWQLFCFPLGLLFLLYESHWSVVPLRGELQQVLARLPWQTDVIVIRLDGRLHSRCSHLLLECDPVLPLLLHILDLTYSLESWYWSSWSCYWCSYSC